jgi:hypothetical protein
MDEVAYTGMKKLFVLVCLALVSGCSKTTPPTDGDTPTAGSTFWQLEDDSELHVAVTPWPPKGGKATVEAVADIGDWGGSVPKVQSVEYRISKSATSSAPYKAMKRTEKTVGEGEDAVTTHTYSASDVPLESGTSYIHFRVKGEGFRGPAELTDWSVTVP